MLKPALAVALAAFAALPAQSAVVGYSNVALQPSTIFTLGTDASFRFSYDAVAASFFDPSTYSVQTGGTGQTSAFGGFLGIPLAPSAFDQRGITIDNNLFPSYAAFPTPSKIGASLIPVDLALRYTAGADSFFGYARLNGNGTLNFAFENTANTAIVAGSAITGPGNIAVSVPEPAAWAMMLSGFGLAGAAMRRRKAFAPATA